MYVSSTSLIACMCIDTAFFSLSCNFKSHHSSYSCMKVFFDFHILTTNIRYGRVAEHAKSHRTIPNIIALLSLRTCMHIHFTCRTTKASTATEAVMGTAANTPTLSQLPGGAAATSMVYVKRVPCPAAQARRRAHSSRISLRATSENLNCLCARRVEIP